jgi:transposase
MTARKKHLSAAERTSVLLYLASVCSDKKRLPPGISASASQKFGISIDTVRRLWTKYWQQGTDAALSSARSNCGRKKNNIDMEALQEIPYAKRGTIRSTAQCLGIPKSTLHNHVKYGEFKIVTSTVKPMLTEVNKFHRMVYCLRKLIPFPDLGIAKYDEDYNTIHVDEKWFFQTSITRRTFA